MFNLISKIPFWCNVDYRKQGPHSPIHLTLPMNRPLLSLCLSSLRGRRKMGRGRGEGEREKGRERLPPPLPNPPPLFPFLPIPYPLPLSTPATQATAWVPVDVWSWGKLILLAEILAPNKSSFCRITSLVFSFVLIRRTLFKSNSRSFRRNRRPYCFACSMLLAGLAQLQRRRKQENKQDRAAHFLRVSWTSLRN